jgi:polyphosphate glucokinase
MLRLMTQPTDDPFTPAPGTRLSGTALGIDIGGTGVKAAVIELSTGELLSSRVRLKTPTPATPEAVLKTVRQVVDGVAAEHDLAADLPVGCGLPGIVKYGRLLTAANIDPAWVDTPVEDMLAGTLGRPVHAVNDADAAGVAEMRLGAGRGHRGTVILLTIGTGIGSALFIDEILVPNTEFGHLEFKGKDAETLVSGAARNRRDLSWSAWALEFDEYLARLELYFSPDLFIFSGGVSKSMSKYSERLHTRAPIIPAHFLNLAGIIGAAMSAAAARQTKPQPAP